MGMFLEGGAALMIITPLLLPVARQLGINDYHFGLVAIVNLSLIHILVRVMQALKKKR